MLFFNLSSVKIVWLISRVVARTGFQATLSRPGKKFFLEPLSRPKRSKLIEVSKVRSFQVGSKLMRDQVMVSWRCQKKWLLSISWRCPFEAIGDCWAVAGLRSVASRRPVVDFCVTIFAKAKIFNSTIDQEDAGNASYVVSVPLLIMP